MQARWTQAQMREIAGEERQGLGCVLDEALDPYALCEEHGIPVYSIKSLQDAECGPEVVAHFTRKRVRVWSAALVPVGRCRLIIENTAHHPVRRRSSIAHELGHHLLEHGFDHVLLNDEKCRNFDPLREREATFLSAELLVPYEAAKRAAFADWSNEQVATKFGVSEQFAQMCMKGVRVMAARARVKQASAGQRGGVYRSSGRG
jgi:IrrE N-terminal-like domain